MIFDFWVQLCWFWRWRFSSYIKRLQELEPAHSILLRWTNRRWGWKNTSKSPWTARDKEYNWYWSCCNYSRLQETSLLGLKLCENIDDSGFWAVAYLSRNLRQVKTKSIGVLNWFALVNGNMFDSLCLCLVGVLNWFFGLFSAVISRGDLFPAALIPDGQWRWRCAVIVDWVFSFAGGIIGATAEDEESRIRLVKLWNLFTILGIRVISLR